MEFSNNKAITSCRFCTLLFDDEWTIPTQYGVCEQCVDVTPDPLMQAYRVFIENKQPTSTVFVRLSGSEQLYSFRWCDIKGAWIRFHDLGTERMMYLNFQDIVEVWQD